MAGYNPYGNNPQIPPHNSTPINIYEIPNTQNPPPGVVRGTVGGGVYPPNVMPSSSMPTYSTSSPYPCPTPPTNPNYNVPMPNNNPYIIGQEPYQQPFPSNPAYPYNQADPYGMNPTFNPNAGRPAYYPPAQGSVPQPPPNNSQYPYGAYPQNPNPNPQNFRPPPGPSYPGSGYGKGFGNYPGQGF